jgi:hypothetical protein
MVNGERRNVKRETITSEDEHDDEDDKRLMPRQKTEVRSQKTDPRTPNSEPQNSER